MFLDASNAFEFLKSNSHEQLPFPRFFSAPENFFGGNFTSVVVWHLEMASVTLKAGEEDEELALVNLYETEKQNEENAANEKAIADLRAESVRLLRSTTRETSKMMKYEVNAMTKEEREFIEKKKNSLVDRMRQRRMNREGKEQRRKKTVSFVS